MNLELGGKVALVVGASRGVGRAAALSLAREGCDVAVLARTREPLEAAANEIRALGRKASAQVCDVADSKSLSVALDSVRGELGAPTIVVLSVAAL